MKPSEILQKIGKSVTCPADMGNNSYKGIVIAVEPDLKSDIYGVEYYWAHVKDVAGFISVWPSHRLK